MSGKTILEPKLPQSQSVEAVKTLITTINHGRAPKEIPSFYRMSGELVLILSSKKDSYYVTAPRECSCPARTYHSNKPCKHMKRFFKASEKSTSSNDDLLKGLETSFLPEDEADAIEAKAKIEEAKAKAEESRGEAQAYQSKKRLARNLARLGQAESVDSIMPKNAGRWAGNNGPVEAV